MDALQIAAPLLTALGVSALATPVVARIATSLNVVDRPNERKVNLRAGIPLLGGLAVAFGHMAGILVALLTGGLEAAAAERLVGFVIGAVILLAVGAWDDRYGMRAYPKLSFQIVAAAAAYYFGFRIDYFTEPFSQLTMEVPEYISFPATVLWIVGVTNAVNLIDGLDGLATGLGGIIAATLAVICWQADQAAGVIFAVTLVGALAGFLPFNFPPARIFLGDTGALFVGYALSLLALQGYRKEAFFTFLVPLLALAVPLLDTGVSVLRRIKNRRPIFVADRFHMHHRLLESEGSDRAAVMSLYFLTSCFCVIAVSFTQLEGYAAVIFLGAVALLTIRLLRNLGVFGTEADDEKPPPPVASRQPVEVEGEHQ